MKEKEMAFTKQKTVNLTDEELVDLCNQISQGQRKEIEQMNAIRARLGKSG